mmetsp:Transcript_26177/g.72213  ORF Transcript_26177/g.72213 Transcript_26177/m.72213 type:complete len:463 (-) Transcript_26177:6489-7877(-)
MPDPLSQRRSFQSDESSEDEIDFGDGDLNFGDQDDALEDIDLERGDQASNNTPSNTSQETMPRSPSSLRFWPLRIKSSRDVLIRVRPIETIGKVKESVLQALGEESSNNNGRNKKTDKKYVRLVCKGRLLAPDNAILKELKFVEPNDVVHAVLTTSQQQRPGVQAAIQQGNLHHLSRRALRSAGINANGMAVRRTAEEQEQDDDSSSSGDERTMETGGRSLRSSRRRRGFDRLRVAGLSRGEISALRAYFSRHVDRFIESNPRIAEELQSQDALVQRRLQEEAWMYSQGPASEFRLNLPAATLNNPASRLLFGSSSTGSNDGGSTDQADDSSNNPWVREIRITASRNGLETNITSENGTTTWPRSNTGGATSTNVGNDRDFLCGFMLGFFVGFLMLVWVWMPTVPHKQKLGILTGITVQLALNTLRPQPNDEDNFPNDADGLNGVPNAYAKLGEIDDAVVLG